jgi:hypothetical protein
MLAVTIMMTLYLLRNAFTTSEVSIKTNSIKLDI